MKSFFSALTIFAITMPFVFSTPTPRGVPPHDFDFSCSTDVNCGIIPTEKNGCGAPTTLKCGNITNDKNRNVWKAHPKQSAGVGICAHPAEMDLFYTASEDCYCFYPENHQSKPECRKIEGAVLG